MRATLLILSTWLFAGCSTLSFFESEPSASDSSAEKAPSEGHAESSPKPSSADDLELRVARLSSRIDELETELVQQKERTKLIEKGLLLGLVPDELKSDKAIVQ